MERARVLVRSGVIERDWTKGSILRNLLSLAWPMMINNSLNMLGPTIDLVWVGKLGAASIAGVGIAGIAEMLVNSAFIGVSVGVRAMVARFVGAGEKESAIHVARQAFVISAAYAILMAFVGIFFAEHIMRLVGVEEDVIMQGAPYLRIVLVGAATNSFRAVAEGIMQASGDTVTPMKIAVFFRFFHIILCPFLIFGWWVFPRLGVSGAAISNVLSQGVGMVLVLWVAFSGYSRLKMTLSKFQLDFSVIWRIVKIGIPASITGMERTFAQFVLMWIMVPFGTLAVAAHTLVQRVDMVIFMPIMGMGLAAGVLAGQNLGAKQPERAEKGGWFAVIMAEGFAGLCLIAIFIEAEGIMRIFGAKPDLVELAASFLRIATASFMTVGLYGVLQQCISATGDTLPPMLVTLLTMWLVQIPLALILPELTGLGVYGVRWAMVSGTIVGAAVYATYFRCGRWKRKKV